jgi:hypothetical protein
MMLWRLTLIGSIGLLSQLLACNGRESARTYDDSEAYNVYAAILPTSKPLLIRDETRTHDFCLAPLDAQAAHVLDPAIKNFHELNDRPWRLQHRLDTTTRYELLPAEELESTFAKGPSGVESSRSWESFFKIHPASHGWVELSAVGFNDSKTIAVVGIDHHCGEQCEAGEFLAMEKANGSWHVLKGKGKWSHCIWVVDGHRI